MRKGNGMFRRVGTIAIAIVFHAGAIATVVIASEHRSKEVQQVLDQHERRVQMAVRQYDAAVDRANRQTVLMLQRAASLAEKAGEEEVASGAFKEILRLDRDNEEARAYFGKSRKLDAVLTQLTLEWNPRILAPAPETEKTIFYETMLGQYRSGSGNSQEWLPARTLVVPDGKNIYSDVVRARIAKGMKKPGLAEVYTYKATGHFAVPEDGKYLFSGFALVVRVDGENVAGLAREGKPQSIILKGGMHDIYIETIVGYAPSISILALDRRRERVPIFNSLAEIKAFLAPPTEEHAIPPFDVSRWSPTRAKQLKITLPLAAGK